MPGSFSGASVTIAREPAGGVEQALHRVDVGRPDGVVRVRPRYPSNGLMNGPSMCSAGIIWRASGSALAQLDKSAEAVLHDRDVFGRDRRQEAGDAVTLHGGADLVQFVGGEVVAVEVDAGVAVDLEVEIPARNGHDDTAFPSETSRASALSATAELLYVSGNNSANEILLFVRRRQKLLGIQPVATHDLSL